MSEECSIETVKRQILASGPRVEDPLRPDLHCTVKLFCMTLSWVGLGSPSSPDPALPTRLFRMTLSWIGSLVLAHGLAQTLEFLSSFKLTTPPLEV